MLLPAYLSTAAAVKERGIIIIIIVHLRMQPEGYGLAIYIFGLQARIASSFPRFLFLRCCEVLLSCRLVSIFISPSGGCFLVSSGLKSEAKCREEKRKKERRRKGKRRHLANEKTMERQSQLRLLLSYSPQDLLAPAPPQLLPPRPPPGSSISLPQSHSSPQPLICPL